MFKTQSDNSSTAKADEKKEVVSTSDSASKKIKWGTNSLGGGLKTTAFKTSGLFGISKKEETAIEKKEKSDKKEPIALKWGSGKTSLLEKVKVQQTLVQPTQSEVDETKEEVDKEDVIFQMRVKAYLLEDNEYHSRGKGTMKIIRYTISFFHCDVNS